LDGTGLEILPHESGGKQFYPPRQNLNKSGIDSAAQSWGIFRVNRYFLRAVLLAIVVGWSLADCPGARALDRTNEVFKVFQFPADQIPRIDGDTNDWNIVPESYVIGTDQLVDDSGKHSVTDASTPKIRVKVGWVKGLNRLYFLYEADDDYWDFSQPDLHNDTFELVVDGDLSGGPLIEKFSPLRDKLGQWETYFQVQSVHAQNYHIFTPARDKDWCMFWGPAQWAKALPYANAAQRYDFQPGQPGHYVLEFWITPFDCAPADPLRAVETKLTENQTIGLAFALIDYDDVNSGGTNNGFWNLSRHHTMYGNADYLCAFKLMPLEPQFVKAIAADWSWSLRDEKTRAVAFKDLSVGEIKRWHWDFGDGETSIEPNPIHNYKNPGNYVVVLDVEGAAGKARRSKVWDVTVK
jgi:hypothetical protein